MGTKAKKSVYRYENSVNMLNCITYKSTKKGKVTEADERIPQTPYKASGDTKEERFKNLPFSKEHNYLIDSTYSKENRLVKQQAAEAQHEIRIQRIIAAKKRALHDKEQANKAKMPYVVTIERADSKGTPYIFSTNYSDKPLKLLKTVVDNLSQELHDKWKDFRTVSIYKKENLLPNLKANPAEYTVHHYNMKTKNAA